MWFVKYHQTLVSTGNTSFPTSQVKCLYSWLASFQATSSLKGIRLYLSHTMDVAFLNKETKPLLRQKVINSDHQLGKATFAGRWVWAPHFESRAVWCKVLHTLPHIVFVATVVGFYHCLRSAGIVPSIHLHQTCQPPREEVLDTQLQRNTCHSFKERSQTGRAWFKVTYVHGQADSRQPCALPWGWMCSFQVWGWGIFLKDNRCSWPCHWLEKMRRNIWPLGWVFFFPQVLL